MLIAHQDYLTVSEAAAHLRVSPDAVRRWAREGHLVNGHVKVPTGGHVKSPPLGGLRLSAGVHLLSSWLPSCDRSHRW